MFQADPLIVNDPDASRRLIHKRRPVEPWKAGNADKAYNTADAFADERHFTQRLSYIPLEIHKFNRK